MHSIMEIFRLLPQFDCGACGNPVCITLSRRIATGWQKPKDCMYISNTNMKRIHELLDEGVDIGPKDDDIPNGHIIEIQPCAHYGKVTLEAQLSRPTDSIFDVFDSCEMCTSLGNAGLLKNVKCSLELGYSLAEYRETRIHLSKSGKVVMRHAQDRALAMEAMEVIKRCLWGAVVCSCGNPAVECLANGCTAHHSEPCHCLAWGLTTKTYELEREMTHLIRGNNLETAKLFIACMKELDQLIGILKRRSNTILQNSPRAKPTEGEQIRKILTNASRLAIEFMITTIRAEDASLGLILRALIRCLGRISDGLIDLQDELDPNLIQQAFEIVFKSYKAFKNGEKPISSVIAEKLNTFKTQWNEQSRDVNLIKIATNGFSISRLPSIMLPK
ncbi:MAG: (Fe-S)-binding protein [Candidatus Heimdallarchaeota archaeon]